MSWTKTQIVHILKNSKTLYNTPRTRKVGIGGNITDRADLGETYLLFKWLWLSGLKIKDVLKVKVSDINFEDYKVTYQINKKRVSLMLPAYFLFEIKNYLIKKGTINQKEAKLFTLSKRTYQKRILECLKLGNFGLLFGTKRQGLHYFRLSFTEYVTAFLKEQRNKLKYIPSVPDVTLFSNYLDGNTIDELYSRML